MEEGVYKGKTSYKSHNVVLTSRKKEFGQLYLNIWKGDLDFSQNLAEWISGKYIGKIKQRKIETIHSKGKTTKSPIREMGEGDMCRFIRQPTSLLQKEGTRKAIEKLGNGIREVLQKCEGKLKR